MVHPLESVRHHQPRGAEQPDAIDGQGGHLLRMLGEGQVGVDPRRQRPRAAQPAHLRSGRHGRSNGGGRCAFGHGALGPVDSDQLPVAEHRRRVAGAHDRRNPSSRRCMAGWHVMPPPSVTMAAARRMVGTQSGLVIGATRTSPAWSRSPWSGDCNTRTTPEARPARPRPDEQRPQFGRRCSGGGADGRDRPRSAPGRSFRPPWPTRCPGASRSAPRRRVRSGPTRGSRRRRGPGGRPRSWSSSTRSSWPCLTRGRSRSTGSRPGRADRGPSFDTT